MSAEQKRTFVILAVVSVLVITTQAALAFTSGSATDTGFEFWDFVVNKGIKGPIGATIGVLMIGGGMVLGGLGKLQGAVWPLIAGGGFIATPGIVTSMGMVF